MLQRALPLPLVLLAAITSAWSGGGCARQRAVTFTGNATTVDGDETASDTGGDAASDGEDADIDAAVLLALESSPESVETVEIPAGPDEFAALREKYASARVQSRFSGQASYYSDKLAGNHTASGERYDPARPTAAHRRLPFGSVVRVVCPSTGRRVIVRITDRGPFGHRRRVIDLSRSAAEALGILTVGVAHVQVELLALPRRTQKKRAR